MEIRESGYRLISPLLDCYPSVNPDLRTLKVLEDDLNEYLESVYDSGYAQQVSVYFRDLNNGPWLGIREEAFYAPASLLKLPILIAALKFTETHPDYPTRSVQYIRPKDTFRPVIITGDTLQPGQSYTIRELMERMIIYSDNEAKNIIMQSISLDRLKNIFLDLGIDFYKETGSNDFISVREYAGFFRVLYNASYLNKDMSEFALSLLSNTAYNQGITAGIPDNVVVAHKFGERSTADLQVRQLHDCGIVYLKGKPYILCVMTRGKNFDQLSRVISTISKIVYQSLSGHS